jgi:hypothetical protein
LINKGDVSLAKNRYALAPNGKGFIEVSWLGIVYDGREMTISFDGKGLGGIPDAEALLSGQEFLLPDGSPIKIQLTEEESLQVTHGGNEIICLENSFIIPNTKSYSPAEDNSQDEAMIQSKKAAYKSQNSDTIKPDPELSSYKLSYRIVLFIGYFLLAIALFSVAVFPMYILVNPFYVLLGQGNFPITLIGGALFILLGYLAKRKQSRPLVFAVSAYGIYTLYYIILSVSVLTTEAAVGLIVELLLFLAFSTVFFLLTIAGIKAINSMNRRQEASGSGESAQA